MLNRRYLPILACLCVPFMNAQAADGGFFTMVPSQQWPRLLTMITLGVFMAIGFLAILVLYTVLRPASVRATGEYASCRPWRSLIAGTLLLIVVALALRIVDALPEPVKPIPLLALLACSVYLLVSGLAAITHELGDRVLSSLNSRFLGSAVMSVIIGGILFAALGFVPFVGWTIQFIISALALGTAVLGLRRSHPEIKPPPVTHDAE